MTVQRPRHRRTEKDGRPEEDRRRVRPVKRAAVLARGGVCCRDELTGMAVVGPNDRLQQVRGAV